MDVRIHSLHHHSQCGAHSCGGRQRGLYISESCLAPAAIPHLHYGRHPNLHVYTWASVLCRELLHPRLLPDHGEQCDTVRRQDDAVHCRRGHAVDYRRRCGFQDIHIPAHDVGGLGYHDPRIRKHVPVQLLVYLTTMQGLMISMDEHSSL